MFQEIRPGPGFETGDFVEEKLGELPYNDSNVVLPPPSFDFYRTTHPPMYMSTIMI